MRSDEALCRAALEEVRGLGDRGRDRLLEVYGNATHIFRAGRLELRDAGLDEEQARAVRGFHLGPVARRLERLHPDRVELLWPGHPEYPKLLQEIPDPPRMLYRRGSYAPDEPAVAIVGARRASHFARHAAALLAEGLAATGLVVVSGFARGVDTAAHRAALAAGGRTAAVLGCGIDVPYPRENARLRDEVVENGAIFSEFPPGSAPEPYRFPRRNRLISGLCRGVVVVEGSRRSGSLITARLAGEQGREILAVPHRFTDRRGSGTNDLIRDGAKPVFGVEDVLEALPPDVRARLRLPDAEETAGEQGTPPGCSPEETAVLAVLRPDEAIGYDRIAGTTGLAPARLATVLVGLELRGLVRQEPGLRFLALKTPYRG